MTSIDRGIENELKIRLHQLIPDAGYIAEESGWESKPRLNWVIDPIDGTTNFINGLSYAVSVALVDIELSLAIIGIVYNPQNAILYYACNGEGSCIIKNGVKKRLNVGEFPAEEGVTIFGMLYNRDGL